MFLHILLIPVIIPLLGLFLGGGAAIALGKSVGESKIKTPGGGGGSTEAPRYLYNNGTAWVPITEGELQQLCVAHVGEWVPNATIAMQLRNYALIKGIPLADAFIAWLQNVSPITKILKNIDGTPLTINVTVSKESFLDTLSRSPAGAIFNAIKGGIPMPKLP